MEYTALLCLKKLGMVHLILLLYFSPSYCPHIINNLKSVYSMNTRIYQQQIILESLEKHICLWKITQKDGQLLDQALLPYAFR